MNKRTTKKIQPEEKLNSEQKDDGSQVSFSIANALVVCRPDYICLSGIEKEDVLKAYDIRFFRLLKNGVICSDDYFLCRDFAVCHPTKYHENILRSLKEKSKFSLSAQELDLVNEDLLEQYRNS